MPKFPINEPCIDADFWAAIIGKRRMRMKYPCTRILCTVSRVPVLRPVPCPVRAIAAAVAVEVVDGMPRVGVPLCPLGMMPKFNHPKSRNEEETLKHHDRQCNDNRISYRVVQALCPRRRRTTAHDPSNREAGDEKVRGNPPAPARVTLLGGRRLTSASNNNTKKKSVYTREEYRYDSMFDILSRPVWKFCISLVHTETTLNIITK